MTNSISKKTKPRKLQEIFDATIESGIYGERVPYNSSVHMCIALKWAAKHGVITIEERDLADDSIANYMIKGFAKLDVPGGKSNSLHMLLEAANLPANWEYRIGIYRNWAARPRITHRRSRK